MEINHVYNSVLSLATKTAMNGVKVRKFKVGDKVIATTDEGNEYIGKVFNYYDPCRTPYCVAVTFDGGMTSFGFTEDGSFGQVGGSVATLKLEEVGMFEGAKVGDRVWSIVYGWGTLSTIDNDAQPIYYVDFKRCNEPYTFEGKRLKGDCRQTLFWDEVKITPPPRPKLKVKKYVNLWWESEEERDKKDEKHKRKIYNGYIHDTKGEALEASKGSLAAGVEIEVEE